ncbi:hypothetical protein [Haloechinothrix sp. LS1_15]|uniref:hypothetical protein n=1 Tax=Haloechinothrix sp. LS1_15 TaxID=2652248 RepID=UPI00294B586A|nr:hypothetical protein [Haloechinothrix sp. LS1_15]
MSAEHPEAAALTSRDRAILLAVRAGRAELTCSAEPDLFIDGLCFCDQGAAHRLVHDGLIVGAAQGAPGARVPATLTARGSAIASGEAAGTWARPGSSPPRTGRRRAAK